MPLTFPFTEPDQTPEFMKYRIDEGRPMKVISIGAGYTGLVCCIRIPRKFKNIEFVCYEKNPVAGGTWYENTYPGIACDIPSHAYQASFEPNPDWTQYYSSGPEILKYFQAMAVKYDAMKYIRFNTKMIESFWQEDKKMWKVTLQNAQTGETFVDECNVLIGCYGILNRPYLAPIQGRDDFKGDLIHPAYWNHSVSLDGKRVAVIGTGSSAIQIIPAIKDKVTKLDNYARSKTWITSGFGSDLVPKEGVTETRGAGGVNFSYTPEDIIRFKTDPEYYRAYERNLRDALSCLHLITFKQSPLATTAQKSTSELMRKKSSQKPEIAEAMIPNWTIGCRRLTPGTDYIEALCQDHVDMITTTIERFDETGIVTIDGKHRDYDVIVLASGFDASFKVCPIYGRKGVNLNDLYDIAPESYLGLNPPEMPNYFVPAGPNGIVTTGSFLPVLEYATTYIMSCLEKMQRERIASMTPKAAAVKAYSRHCSDYFKETVYTESCGTWFRSSKNEPNRVTALYPGSFLHYRNVLSHPRWEDYEYEMVDGDDIFSYMGNGMTEADITMEGNFAPYMDLEVEFPELKDTLEELKVKEDSKPEAVHAIGEHSSGEYLKERYVGGEHVVGLPMAVA